MEINRIRISLKTVTNEEQKPVETVVLLLEQVAFIVMYLQPIITQYFIGNKSEIWSLSLIVHSKG